VGPELPARSALVDPVLLHVGEEIHLSVGFEKVLYRNTGVWRDGSSMGSAVGCVGGRVRVILAAI
jgi:hypothetical protein